MMCAGLEKGGADSCQVRLPFIQVVWLQLCVVYKICSFKISAFQGDSGGPLIIQRENKQHEIVGVVSWGKHIDDDTQLIDFDKFWFELFIFHSQVLAVPDQIILAFIRE